MITFTPQEIRKIMIIFQEPTKLYPNQYHLVIQFLLVLYGLRKGFIVLMSEYSEIEYHRTFRKIEYCIRHFTLEIHTFEDGILITRSTELPDDIQGWLASPFTDDDSSDYYAIETNYGKTILFHYGYDRDWFEWCNYVVEFIYFVTYQLIPLRIKK